MGINSFLARLAPPESDTEYWDNFREKELRFERFTGWTECPRCLSLDLHSIKDSMPQSCRRICNKCTYVWRQV